MQEIVTKLCLFLQYSEKSGMLIVTPQQGLNFPGSEHLEMKALDKSMSSECF